MHDDPTVGVPADDPDTALLAGLPDDPAALVWPSQVWNDHLAGCDQPRRCPHVHEVALPEWWVAKVRRGVPLDADVDTALAIAMRRVNTYRGDKNVSEVGAAFARDVVRDALPAAPQPVSKSWVSQALAVTGAFATWVHNQGEPLTREHVFAEATRRRWLTGRDGPMHLSEYSRRNYRLRLDIMASILLGSQRETITGRKPLPIRDPLLPLTRQEETDLWVWSEGLRPITVRQRIQAVIVMGLGRRHPPPGLRVRAGSGRDARLSWSAGGVPGHLQQREEPVPGSRHDLCRPVGGSAVGAGRSRWRHRTGTWLLRGPTSSRTPPRSTRRCGRRSTASSLPHRWTSRPSRCATPGWHGTWRPGRRSSCSCRRARSRPPSRSRNCSRSSSRPSRCRRRCGCDGAQSRDAQAHLWSEAQKPPVDPNVPSARNSRRLIPTGTVGDVLALLRSAPNPRCGSETAMTRLLSPARSGTAPTSGSLTATCSSPAKSFEPRGS